MNERVRAILITPAGTMLVIYYYLARIRQWSYGLLARPFLR